MTVTPRTLLARIERALEREFDKDGINPRVLKVIRPIVLSTETRTTPRKPKVRAR